MLAMRIVRNIRSPSSYRTHRPSPVIAAPSRCGEAESSVSNVELNHWKKEIHHELEISSDRGLGNAPVRPGL